VLVNGDEESCRLRIALNCPPYESGVYEKHLSAFAANYQLTLHSESVSSIPADGCPDFVLKTTPDQAISLARRIAIENDLSCIALCYNGVVHGYLKNSLTTSATEVQLEITRIIERCSKEIHAVGGDWKSRHILAVAPSGVEVTWFRQLEKEFASQ
jgi:hypothetical protein